MSNESIQDLLKYRELLKKVPLCNHCLGNPMFRECADWCKEAQRLRMSDSPRDNVERDHASFID